MISVRPVSGRKEQKEFVEFPLRLYKDCPQFVPPLYSDEMAVFKKDYVYYDTSEAVYYLAWDGDKVVGRISGILQKASNEKWGQKRVRFTRFDASPIWTAPGRLPKPLPTNSQETVSPKATERRKTP